MTWSPESVNFGIVVALLSGFVSGVFAPIPIPFKSKRPFGPQQFGYLKKAAPHNGVPRSINCPYDYLLNIYGQHHFEPFVQWFKPSLEQDDPQKYSLILDIMDAVHFCLILVDDISDDSSQRKSQPTAHTLYGASETANRAYFVLTQVINRALREHPVLGVELMKALEDILHGQDKSLIWRRDGLSSFPTKSNERIAAYKEMAQLKTGTLFKLLGRLLNDGSTELDDVLIRFG